jgi:hypothetical protein
MTQVNVDKGVVFWPDRFLDKGQSRLLWRSSAFFDIAHRAGTNYIFPDCFATHTPWDNVVKGQFTGRISFAAILTSIFITSEDVSAIKFDLVSRQTVVK